MIKRYQIENIVPLFFSIISLSLMINYFSISLFYFVGLFIIISGLIIWWIGKITLNDAFTAMPKARRLITKGIYSKIRHPIYIGLSLTLLGWLFLIYSSSLMILIILVIISLIIRGFFEEKVLIKKFGKEYSDYKKKSWF